MKIFQHTYTKRHNEVDKLGTKSEISQNSDGLELYLLYW